MYQFLILSHIIGTVLGVGGATFAEILSMRALKDGTINKEESALLKAVYTTLRVGLIIAVLSGFGFLLFFRINGQEDRLLDPQLWAKMTIVTVLVFNALLLTLHRIPFWLGGAISLTSWYAALVLGSWRGLSSSYVNIILVYILAIFLVAGILHVIKKWYFRPPPKNV